MHPGTRESVELAVILGTQAEMGPFISLCNVYPRLVPKLSNVTRPLNSKLERDQAEKFDQLTDGETESFEAF